MAAPLYAEQVKNTELIVNYLEEHIELFEASGSDEDSLKHLRTMLAFETRKLKQLKQTRPDFTRC